MLNIVQSFHEGMQARGCGVVSSWHTSCPETGVGALFKLGRKLVGDRTTKAKLDVVKVTESQIVDDVALYTTTRDCLKVLP